MSVDRKLKFIDGDFSMDVTYSEEDKTIWMSVTELATLFEKSKYVISRRLKSILESSVSVVANYDTFVAKRATTGNDGKTYFTTCYRLEIVFEIAKQFNSDRGIKLKELLDEYLRGSKAKLDSKIIIYNNGSVNLSVNVSPEEETVWLTVSQIAELFETTYQNVYMHINNVLEEGEIENSVFKDFLNTQSVTEDSSATQISVCKDFLHTQKEILTTAADGKTYLTTYYNLDMILAVGYRVKSKRAIEFRRWASSKLKEIILTGHITPSDRLSLFETSLIRISNDVINLVTKYEEHDKRITELENRPSKEPIEILFYKGQFFDAFDYISGLIAQAEQEVVIIDAYFDNAGLKFLTRLKQGIRISVYHSSFAKITESNLIEFEKQYNHVDSFIIDDFHDRIIIIDKCEGYHLGTSFNYMSNKGFNLVEIYHQKIIDAILELVGYR